MKNELKTQVAKRSQEEQYQIRKSIIRLSQKGKGNEDISEILDVSLRHVQKTKKQYMDGGIAAIKLKTRGRRKGAKRIRSSRPDILPSSSEICASIWGKVALAPAIVFSAMS